MNVWEAPPCLILKIPEGACSTDPGPLSHTPFRSPLRSKGFFMLSTHIGALNLLQQELASSHHSAYLDLSYSLLCFHRDLCLTLVDKTSHSLYLKKIFFLTVKSFCCRVQTPEHMGSVPVSLRLSCPEACGILVP